MVNLVLVPSSFFGAVGGSSWVLDQVEGEESWSWVEEGLVGRITQSPNVSLSLI